LGGWDAALGAAALTEEAMIMETGEVKKFKRKQFRIGNAIAAYVKQYLRLIIYNLKIVLR
jgi:hypothetical protein